MSHRLPERPVMSWQALVLSMAMASIYSKAFNLTILEASSTSITSTRGGSCIIKHRLSRIRRGRRGWRRDHPRATAPKDSILFSTKNHVRNQQSPEHWPKVYQNHKSKRSRIQRRLTRGRRRVLCWTKTSTRARWISSPTKPQAQSNKQHPTGVMALSKAMTS